MTNFAPVQTRSFPYLLVMLMLGATLALLVRGPLALMVDEILGRGVTEETVTLLLLVPVAATVVVFLRTVVGLDTFGIFAPMILAFTFLTVGIVGGLLVLGALVLVGAPSRLLLDRYHTLAVARLGVLLSIVALVLLGATFVAATVGDTQLLEADAFPLVIIAGIIERFVSAQMDLGPKEAAKLSLFTVISSVIVWLVISPPPVQAVFRSRPDLILLCFPALLLMGRYSGLRLSELIRFWGIARHAAP